MSFEDLLNRELANQALDRRQVFARLRQVDGEWTCEASDTELLQRLTRVLGDDYPQLRSLLLPTDNYRGRAGWIHNSVADVRAEPRHGSEQITQVIQGECVQALAEEDGWLLGRLEDDYVGWIRTWHLLLTDTTTIESFRGRANARVASHWVALRQAPDSAVTTGELLMGNRVCVQEDKGEWLRLLAAAGVEGWLQRSDLYLQAEPWKAERHAILETLQRFVGVPYVWGGKSPKGFDCSGLIQFVFALHGYSLPRDSDQQFECGQETHEAAAGDLVFFGTDQITHVGVLLDEQRFIHARGRVRYNSLSPASDEYDAELQSMYRGARRILDPP